MGLTLNFDLQLAHETPTAQVHALLAQLREHALTLGFQEVSPLFSPADADAADITGSLAYFRHWASVTATAFEEDEGPGRWPGDESSAVGFVVHPGEGSESAVLGLLRRHTEDGTPVAWHWYAFSKTQYASAVSEAHFIACHTSLIALLDKAVTLGFGVDVRDEGRYWETRDEAVLLSEVRKMNHIVAAFVGAFTDKVGDTHHVEAPILEHPRFERLEMGEAE